MKGKKRKDELAFIRALRNIIYKQYEIVIIGDREFAGKEFVKNILRIKNIEVIIRIKKNTNVADIKGNIIRLLLINQRVDFYKKIPEKTLDMRNSRRISM